MAVQKRRSANTKARKLACGLGGVEHSLALALPHQVGMYSFRDAKALIVGGGDEPTGLQILGDVGHQIGTFTLQSVEQRRRTLGGGTGGPVGPRQDGIAVARNRRRRHDDVARDGDITTRNRPRVIEDSPQRVVGGNAGNTGYDLVPNKRPRTSGGQRVRWFVERGGA